MTSGLCECGCGEKTRVAERRNSALGHIAGRPIRFIHGHSGNAFKKGSLHRGWKGGMSLMSNGYLRRHANDGLHTLVHRERAEKALGRPLPPKAEIHHPDRDRGNPTARLVICQDRAYHMLIELRTRAYRATGDPRARKCEICKRWSRDLRECSNGTKMRHLYHPECQRLYQRKIRARRKS